MRLACLHGRTVALSGPIEDPATRALDLSRLTGLPADATGFLAAGGLDAVRALGEPAWVAAFDADGSAVDLAAVGPVVPAPRAVWAVGLNYRDHAAETGGAVPPAPALFTKSPGSLAAHGQPIVVPPHVTQPDYEGEVAIVIGREARDVAADDALSCVAGVTAAHDVSARDHQFVTGQFSWSKSFDTFCPLGPELVTLDGADGPRASAPIDVGALTIETRLNGEVVQSSGTRHLVFPIPVLVSWITQGLTLLPGDVILTGTPAGVGAARTPPRWLVDGDVVEIRVGGVTTLRNPVRRTG